jgi:uncharacterized protein with von Willebrand factor type A (vWA) domain
VWAWAETLAVFGCIGQNADMAKTGSAAAAADNELHIIIEDQAELTAKELAQERKALQEEQQRLTWLSQSAEQLAGRIPVSVFAMGDLVAD